MKKKILYTALTAAFLFSFVGCKKKSDTTTKKTDTIVTTKTNSSTKDNTTTKITTIEKKYTVSFDSNGGSNVVSQEIKKGGKITKPTDPTYEGFDFAGWYIGDTLVDFDTYTVSGEVELKAKWTIGHYKLAIKKNIDIAGNVSKEETYERDTEVTVSAEVTNANYLFDGWYLDGNLVCEELTYTFTMPKNALTLEARFKDDFIYDSNNPTKMIGLKDTSVTSLYIPDTVKYIEIGALKGCSNLKSISIPFVGLKEYDHTETYQLPFGAIFGEFSFEGAETYTRQNYYGPTVGSTVTGQYYIPDSLEEITLTGSSYIQCGAFSSLRNVTTINIPETIKVIDNTAFTNSDGLKEIIIPNSVEEIRKQAFSGCDGLISVKVKDGDGTSNPTIIGDHAFHWCSLLANVELPSNTTTIGEFAFYNCAKLEKITIPSSVTSIGRDFVSNCTCEVIWDENSKATTLSKDAFSSYMGTSIKLPSSIKVIDEYAFSYCTNLTTVTMGNITSLGKRAFYNCKSLSNIDLGNSLESIGDGAFYWCTSLESLTLPNTLTAIGENAFENCTCEIIWEDTPTITTIGKNAFMYYKGENLVIPNTVTSIDYGAFHYCSSLKNLEIPSSVTSIGDWAFVDCSALENVFYKGTIKDWCNIDFVSGFSNPFYKGANLNLLDNNGDILFNENKYSLVTDLVIPSGVTNIKTKVFYECKGITSVTISSSVENIEKDAFFNCRNLVDVTLCGTPNIADDAFYGCYEIKNTYFDGTIDEWCSMEFVDNDTNPVYFSKNLHFLDNNGSVTNNGKKYSLVVDLVIPNTVTKINKKVFYNCKSMTSLVIPSSVTIIEDEAFYGCGNVKNCVLNSGEITIGANAFAGFNYLENFYYNGTIDDWCNITFNNDCSNPSRYGSKFLFLDNNGDVTYNGNKYTSITELVIPDTVTTINSYTFAGFKYKLTIGNGVTSIKPYAFHSASCNVYWGDNPSITTITAYAFSEKVGADVTIPNSVIMIEENAFYNCKCSAEFCDNSMMTTIGYRAFYGYKGGTMHLPTALASIEVEAFLDCDRLYLITIPSSVTAIRENAFYGCSSLTDIYYSGSASDWSRITIDSSDSINVSNVYYYSEERPTTPGKYWHYEYEIYPTPW